MAILILGYLKSPLTNRYVILVYRDNIGQKKKTSIAKDHLGLLMDEIPELSKEQVKELPEQTVPLVIT